MAASKEQCIIFNAAPITAEVNDYPLDLVEIFVVNEVEAEALAGESDPDKILDAMVSQFPNARTILTLGELGARYAFKEQRVVQPAYTVNALDSTGAGDTFTGYFLANYVNNVDIQQCLDIACKAASICVTRQGAAS